MLQYLFEALGRGAAALAVLADRQLAEADVDSDQRSDRGQLCRAAYDNLALAEYLEFLAGQSCLICSSVEELGGYILEHEAQDFADNANDCLPIPGVEGEEWEERLEAYFASWKDEDLEWLALHGTGHVYCTALQLRKKLAVLAVTDPKPLSDQELRYRRNAGNGCPFCGGQIEGDSVDVQGLYVRQEVRCVECGAAWADEYRFTGYEVIEFPERVE